LGDLIEDRGCFSVDSVIDSNIREETAAILKTLSPKEEKVIRLRFGIGCDREHTLEEIGQQFDVTRERIRQIEAKALRQLRSPSAPGTSGRCSQHANLTGVKLGRAVASALLLLVPSTGHGAAFWSAPVQFTVCRPCQHMRGPRLHRVLVVIPR